MMSFRNGRLDAMPIAPAAVWLIGDIMEAKGRQELYTRQAPDVLKALRDLAMVQSVESSNRIEGVTVAPERLRPLVLGKAKPKDRSEEEVRGYREALDWIHREAPRVSITPATIRRLHALCQAGASDAGAWKRVNNEIVELAPDRPPRVRFTPVLAAATPAAVDELCESFAAVISGGEEGLGLDDVVRNVRSLTDHHFHLERRADITCPEDVVRRRFRRSLAAAGRLSSMGVTTWRILAGSGAGPPQLVASAAAGDLTIVRDPAKWVEIVNGTMEAS